jgi:hypothetical protein
MKIKSLLAGLSFCGLVALLCSCVGVGTKFDSPSDEVLVLGKLKPADAFKQFGQPYVKTTKATKEGTYLTCKYVFALNSLGTVSSRVLLLEFKDESLNAYFWWSSFKQDRTMVDTNSFGKLKDGIGKLARQDVLAIAGKPSGKGYCPSTLEDFKDNCDKSSEIWAWYLQDQYQANSVTPPKSKELTVTFDAEGKVSGVQITEFGSLQISRF